jgi:adenylylsulfate kinase
MIIQFSGLSGSGKTLLATKAKAHFAKLRLSIEVIDGDEYRKSLCADLGFSKNDRHINIRRLAFVASRFAAYGIVPIICAINPYKAIREEIQQTYPDVKTVYLKCSLEELIKRDTKGLYARAMLPEDNDQRLNNLSGVNDPFEPPENPDLLIETDNETIDVSTAKLIGFIESISRSFILSTNNPL